MYRMVFILLLIVYIVWCSFYIFQVVRSELGSQSAFRSKHKFSNNIGNKDYSNILSFPPMDAVFTWVNGSDPEWIKEKNYYEKLYNEEHNITNESQTDTATSANRFRDNDELKYTYSNVSIVDTVSVL